MPSSLADRLRAEIRQHEARAAEARRDLAEAIGEAGEDVRPVLLSDALAEPAPPEEWLINGLLPAQCIGFISAEGGVGKSTLIAQICAGLASGQGFFGFDSPSTVRVLFLEAEGSLRKFVERVGVACQHLSIEPGTLPFYIQPKSWTPSLNGSTADTIRSCGANLVVVDTITLFEKFDENSATEFKALVLGPLRRLAEETKAGFLFVHHQGKPSELRKGRHKTRGTSAFVDDTDLAMRLEAPDGDKSPRRVLIFDKVRHGSPHDDIELEYDMSTATFRLADCVAQKAKDEERETERSTARLAKLKASLLAELKKEAMSVSDLLQIAKGRRSDVMAAIRALADEKKIYHEELGRKRVWKVFNDVQIPDA